MKINLIVLPVEEFRIVLESLGFQMRVTNIDGENCEVTRDFEPNRLNVHVINGLVVEMDGWY